MRFYTFHADDQTERVGVETAPGRLLDLFAADPALPHTLLDLIRAGSPALARVQKLVSRDLGPIVELDQIQLVAPLPRPGKILCSGINYRSHFEENPAASMPQDPFFFAKMPSTVIGPGQPIAIPPQSSQVDYEIEFTVVIGKRMCRVSESDALSHVFGYTILHDVSARDVQFKENQITLGKNFDSFCPIGPAIVTADALPEPDRVQLRTFVNDRLMQNGTTADWLFPLPFLLSFLSRVMTLEPGDLVSTGTPAGVGVFQKPPVFLQRGDRVRLEADGVGVLTNPVS